MSAKQALKQIPITQPAVETITLTPRELENFAQEIADMINEGKPRDIRKAIHNAKYLAEIDSRSEDIKSGRNCVTFTDDEWEKFINDQELS